MRIDVTFSESTTKLPAHFADLQIITNGVPPEEVEKLVADGEARGLEAGKQAEYDRFWDAFQQNGRRTDYSYAFSHIGWDETSFRPKYDIRPKNPVAIFQSNQIYDLSGQLKKAGVVLDTSKAANINNMFYQSRIYKVPTISAVGCTSTVIGTFAQSTVEEVEAFILKNDGSNTFNNTFYLCHQLKRITILGTIGQNGFHMGTCPLDRQSIVSVISALSSTTEGLAVTLNRAAVNTAFETASGKADGSASEEWLALVATKPNWTISLV